MASSTTNQDCVKDSICSNLSGKVRIVAKIRGFTDQESRSLDGDSTPWISVRKPNKSGLSEKVTMTFGDQTTSHKHTYEVDYCYEQNEDLGLIFTKEIKPMIARVFDGQKATFISFGARGSGKTYTIQGYEEKPGLATLAIAEILSLAQELRQSVAISIYEVFQDHVYDLLDSKHAEVHVWEDAQGKIKLKGLSQVPVESLSQFQKLYYSESSTLKLAQRIALELPRRSHKGLMINILAGNENSSIKLVGKMTFVDLAGYENARRNSVDGINLVETTKINKSLNALLNVIYALNANENHVPYRESKLTRVLQDSLGGTNHVLLLTCLNPLFCHDSIYTTSLASRSCQAIKSIAVSSTKSRKLATISSSTKKETNSRVPSFAKKANSAVKGWKLFMEGSHSVNSKQAKYPSDNTSANSKVLDIVSATVRTLLEEERSIADNPSAAALEDVSSNMEDHYIEVTPGITGETKAPIVLEACDTIDKENRCLLVNEGQSPPLSERLKELSNNLKSLCSSTSLHLNRPLEVGNPYSGQVGGFADSLEPKTPVGARDLDASGKREIEEFKTPLEAFNKRSSGMKQSLVQEYLQFLNTASKEDLKCIKGIGEKRAICILELREESPEPFKSLEDLHNIGLSAKQVKGMMKKVAGELFS